MGSAVGIGLFLLLHTRLPASEAAFISAEQTPKHKFGLLIAALVAGTFGLLVGAWNVAWGLDVWSLEGAWLWPLCIIPLATSTWLVLIYVKGRRVGGA